MERSWRWSEHRFHWTAPDREAIFCALQPLAEAGIVAEAIPVANAVLPDEGVRAAGGAASDG